MARSSVAWCAVVCIPTAFFLLTQACSPSLPNATNAPLTSSRTGENRCKISKSQLSPLVIDWPLADRALLEARAKKGLVPVRYIGCEIQILSQCFAQETSKYNYTGVSTKVDTETMSSVDDLYAKIPVYAFKFEGELKQSKELNVSMKIVGRYEADIRDVSRKDLSGHRCNQATHLVSGLTVGAFRFYSGAENNASVKAEVLSAGAGGSKAGSNKVLTSDGDLTSCDDSTAKSTEPPEKCSSIIRMELVPVDGASTSASSDNATPSASSSADSPAGTHVPSGSSGVPSVSSTKPDVVASTHASNSDTAKGSPAIITGQAKVNAGILVDTSGKTAETALITPAKKFDVELGLATSVGAKPAGWAAAAPTPYGFGMGARVGALIYGVYAGAKFTYYLGSSVAGPNRTEISARTIEVGGEVGYSLVLNNMFVLRPTVGIGVGIPNGSADASSRLVISPTFLAALKVKQFLIGLDFHYLIVLRPDEKEPNSSAPVGRLSFAYSFF